MRVAEKGAQARRELAEGSHEVGPPTCPFFQATTTSRRRSALGYCLGRANGQLMIPSLFEYCQFCTTQHFRSCEHYGTKVTPVTFASQD